MKLSNKKCQTAKPLSKPYKLSDGMGLYLEVMPSGSKYWRVKYRFNGKEKRIGIDVYPRVSLADGRISRMSVKDDLALGIVPTLKRLEQRQTVYFNASHTFREMVREWYERQTPQWKPHYANIIWHRFEMYIFPHIGNYPFTEIKPMVMLSCL